MTIENKNEVFVKKTSARGRGKSNSSTPQKEKILDQPLVVEKVQKDISNYISNLEGNVYAITGLPEEFIATLFAWVSRSPKSFKEHLQEALEEFDIPTATGNGNVFSGISEKAKAFHEKWTVGYGHSSVAEHAVSHVGIESISRLASAELELSNGFLSITEYSQRYQKPQRGKWHNPFKNSDEKELHDSVEAFYHASFDAFEQLIDGAYNNLKDTYHQSLEFKDLKKRQKENGSDIEALTKIDSELASTYNAFKKLAFEDARYVLPLAMHTQLGVTANGRAWRDALATLGSSNYEESKQLASDIRTEISKVLPVLLKYASPSQYQTNSKLRIANSFKEKNISNSHIRPYAGLVNCESEHLTMVKIITYLLIEHQNISYHQAYIVASRMKEDDVKSIIKDLLHEMQSFDAPPEVFRQIQYKAELFISEANWHQLLRHNRRTNFVFGEPSANFGLTIPPRILDDGLYELLKDIAEQSKELYNYLVEKGYEKEAHYVVLNAHNRQIYMSFDLQEAYHLINLRTSEEAQWDIRKVFNQLHEQLVSVHPSLLSKAKRR